MNNITSVLISKAFSTGQPWHDSTRLARNALENECDNTNSNLCDDGFNHSDTNVITLVDRRFLDTLPPVSVISKATFLPIDNFIVGGLPVSLQNIETDGILYGPGYFQTRVFLSADTIACWRIAVNGSHDNPPPVLLEVWFDGKQYGTLSFDKGDQSWEELSLELQIEPGVYWLWLRFSNDFIDNETGSDRNAYIRSVSINRLEEPACGHN